VEVGVARIKGDGLDPTGKRAPALVVVGGDGGTLPPLLGGGANP
jgi:hypothetical protein